MSDVTATRHPGLNLNHTDRETHDRAESVMFGFWVFMMSDLVLFAVLFATYAAQSVHGIAGGPAPAEIFELKSTLWQTLVLLTSSFTMGLAALALKYRDDRRRLVLWLLVTAALGGTFLYLEGADWLRMARDHGAVPQVSGFLSIFYALTGTHFLHVSAAMVWIGVMLVQIGRFGLKPEVKLRVMRLAILWHLLDVVWIGIFTFVFLFGVVQ
ncbi:cytochrome c oxidase subunit 3 [Wenxinia saemankumensis]|uniref:Cytochrome bo(3) ubiquinol oxidase subunit 3 n=1 Tax=Wenxinia saemankumensis TaxID=1447782 RepID=A0A1M6A3C5_9RHOB|nr:cytochrome c oxidase subunit 3 [Wenxinia saemankumensis]SHI30958.1 cytochrome o ubiquinol oxidase subunit 3 [Wenxinia saemankumensis]